NSNAWNAPEPEAIWPVESPRFGKITPENFYSSGQKRVECDSFRPPHAKSLPKTSILLLRNNLDENPPCIILQLSRIILQLSCIILQLSCIILQLFRINLQL